MTARRSAAASAVLAVVAFAAAVVVAAQAERAPAFAPTSIAADEPVPAPEPDGTVTDEDDVVTVDSEVTVETTRDTRVVPTPDGPIEPEAEPAVAPEPDAAPTLVDAPADAILYRRDCSTWVAVDRNGGRTYAVEGLEQACDVGWTYDGQLVAVVQGTRAERVELLGRDGQPTTSAVVPGKVRGPVAVGPQDIVFCVVDAGNQETLYGVRPGDDAATLLGPGCQPTINSSGQLAWVGSEGGRTVIMRNVDLGPNVAGGVRLADFGESTVLALAWTGDAQRLVAVVRGPRRTEVLAVAPGERRSLLSVARGTTVRIHPSPADGRVVVVSRAGGGAPIVRLVDAATGVESWRRRAEFLPDADWSPYGDEVLLSDRDQWRFVSAQSGRVRRLLERPGDAPAWCCPAIGGPSDVLVGD